jgi:hypothetical protein
VFDGTETALPFPKIGEWQGEICAYSFNSAPFVATKIRPAKYGFPELAGREYWGNLFSNRQLSLSYH